VASDMGWPSERERDGLGRAPPDEGGELVDADVTRVAGAERRAPVGGLLGGGVDRAGGGVLSTRFTVAPSRISTS
jgi:hypothetical protein